MYLKIGLLAIVIVIIIIFIVAILYKRKHNKKILEQKEKIRKNNYSKNECYASSIEITELINIFQAIYIVISKLLEFIGIIIVLKKFFIYCKNKHINVYTEKKRKRLIKRKLVKMIDVHFDNVILEYYTSKNIEPYKIFQKYVRSLKISKIKSLEKKQLDIERQIQILTKIINTYIENVAKKHSTTEDVEIYKKLEVLKVESLKQNKRDIEKQIQKLTKEINSL